MANTFHWTLKTIYDVSISEMTKLVSEHNDFIERQNKEMEKAGKKKPGRTSIGSLSEMKGLPGVKAIKRKR